MKNGIRNTRETIVLTDTSTSYIHLGDIMQVNNLSVQSRLTIGTLTSVTLSIVYRNKSDVDFWYKDLYNMRASRDYDLDKPFPPSATPVVGCHETRRVYTYNSASSDADNGTTVIRPAAIASGDDGRWVDDSGVEYAKYIQLGTLTTTLTGNGNEILEAIDFSGGVALLKIVTVGTASAASVLIIDTNVI